MATEEISCEEKLVKTKLRLNLKDIDKHYSSDGTLKFVKCLPSPILGSQSLALLVHYVQSTKYITLRSVHGVKNLKIQVDLEVLLTDSSRIKIVESYGATPFLDHLRCIHKIRNTEARIQTITGILTLTFEPEDRVALKDELIYKFGESVLEIENAEIGKEAKPKKPMEIKIECQGEKIEFHKSLLAKISDVFQNMVENPNFIESHNGVITMKEVSSNTIKAFKKLLYDERIEDSDLDAELMLFCDRYNIKPMVDLCSQHLQSKITRENLMEIVDAAFKINDDDLLKKAVDFVRLNYRSFDDIEQWENFMKSNPECAVKMMKFMMFK